MGLGSCPEAAKKLTAHRGCRCTGIHRDGLLCTRGDPMQVAVRPCGMVRFFGGANTCRRGCRGVHGGSHATPWHPHGMSWRPYVNTWRSFVGPLASSHAETGHFARLAAMQGGCATLWDAWLFGATIYYYFSFQWSLHSSG